MRVPFHKPYLPEKEKAWADTEVDGVLTNGKYCRELESRIAELHGAEYAITCSSGTMGLFIALRAYSEMVGNFMWIPSFTWKSIKVIIDCITKLKVRYLETDVQTWHSRPVVVPERFHGVKDDRMNHWTFGSAQPVSDEFVREDFVLTDMACGIGVKQDFGDIGVISLSPTKGVTSGEGGLIITNDENLARYMTMQRDLMARMSEFNAAYGLATLGMLNVISRNRADVAHAYIHGLSGAFKTQQIPIQTNWSKFGVVCRDADKVIQALTKAGIETRKYYQPIDPHAKGGPSQALYDSMICLPVYSDVPTKEICDIMNGEL